MSDVCNDDDVVPVVIVVVMSVASWTVPLSSSL